MSDADIQPQSWHIIGGEDTSHPYEAMYSLFYLSRFFSFI